MRLSYLSGVALGGPRVAWQSGERFAVDGDGDVYLVADGVYLRLAAWSGRRLHGHACYQDGVEQRADAPRLPGPRLEEDGRDLVVQVGDDVTLAARFAGLAVQRGRLVVMDEAESVLAEVVDGHWRRPGADEAHWYVSFAALPEFRPLAPHPRQRLSPLADVRPATPLTR